MIVKYVCASLKFNFNLEQIYMWGRFDIFDPHFLRSILWLRYWTSKMLLRIILPSVCLKFSQFSQLFFMPYVGLCVFSLPISLMMTVRMHALYLIIIIKSELWPICHCSGLGNETLVCVVCLSIFLFLLNTWRPTRIVLTDILSQ